MRKTKKASVTRRRGKAKQCSHTHANFEQIRSGARIFVNGCYAIFGGGDPHFGYGEKRAILGAVCADCSERLSLGPSNDDLREVRIEIRAAELEETDHWEPRRISMRERWGFEDHADPDSETEDAPEYMATEGWAAGWLSREIETAHRAGSRDATAWAWDISRPIAEQLAETAASECEAEALGVPLDEIYKSADAANDEDFDDTDARWDATAQAVRDKHVGPLAFVELLVGEEPEQGVELVIEPVACTAPHDGECQPVAWNDGPMVCVVPLRAEPDCRDEDGPEVERIMESIDG